MRSFLRILLIVILLFALAAHAAGALGVSEYRTLQVGSYGDDVQALKERLYALGYFTNNQFNNRYTDDTAKRIKAFEKNCSLPETGIATPALQELLYSSDAVRSGASAVRTLPEVETSTFRTIGPDSNGDDVLALKVRLKELGFFDAKAETGAYNVTLGRAIQDYQRSLGLEDTGIADVALQELIFGISEAQPVETPVPTDRPKEASSRDSSYTPVATPVPSKTTAPTSTPIAPSVLPDMPQRTAEGFLADPDAEPFTYSNRDLGRWYYISQDLSIEIVRMYNKRQNITWFEVDIHCTSETLPKAFLAKGSRADGHNYLKPKEIANQYNAIFAISDDFYGFRWYNKLKQGVIIRNGEIKANESMPASNKKWPYLEILALFDDGSMRTYESDEHTAQEYLDMGVIDTFAFGPILVHEGVIDQSLYDKSVLRYTDDEPRMALGCVEPYHYIIVTAKGRTNDSEGVTMHWLAERMKALGCEYALNLDGGNTVAIYFMGDVLNKVKNSTSYRDISSMFGFAEPGN
ncbi:MAG: phosphodiester glycosidase family protein [Clostridia bacterium]|nr:phosphodiester glycosidase family protein [Clostridia bacterium]MBR5382451.1 phosphodiester glycosidase family protein [Clostridia bacterium]